MLDNIIIELKVTAVQADTDIWMQGDLEIMINSEKPYGNSDIIESDILLQSLESNGKYFIFSCCCGLPKCTGWNNGIEVIHENGIIKWIDPNHNRTWHFDKKIFQENIAAIFKEVEIFKKFFKEKQIDYVGFGYDI